MSAGARRHSEEGIPGRPEPAPGPDEAGADLAPPVPAGGSETPTALESVLDGLDTAVEAIPAASATVPTLGIAVPAGEEAGRPESLRSGIVQAGPVAVAGMLVNGASAIVVVVVARMVSARSYGTIAQLLGLFFILSMPGSAVLVGVVRRVTAWQRLGRPDLVRRWTAKVHAVVAAGVAVEMLAVWLLQGWIARELSLADDHGVFLILSAAGIWIFLSVDRGLLQAHREYRALAGNLIVEGVVRTACIVVLVALGLGVSGYALGIFLGEAAAAGQARWLAARAWSGRRTGQPSPDGAAAGEAARPVEVVVRATLLADVGAAFVGLALLGLLQNVDVIVLGRLDHAQAGAYAAISVASKALVFGALALGSYLLPEATIRWNDGGHAMRQLGVTLLFLAVPAAVLLGIALFVPRTFLTLIFSARLATAAPAFAALVAAMIFLCVSVLLTNYLFGAGRRWIVLLLAGGSLLATALVASAHGAPLPTARGDMVAQASLAVVMGVAFVAIHHRQRRGPWTARAVAVAPRVSPSGLVSPE